MSERLEDDQVATMALHAMREDLELKAQYGKKEPDLRPAFLFVERGPGAGQLLELKLGSVIIGRASVSDLRLQHPSISRRHAYLKRVGEQFFVKDLGSQNGTFVNKHRISGEIEAYPGDTIVVGNALLRLRGPASQDDAPRGRNGASPRERHDTAVIPGGSTAVNARNRIRLVAVISTAIAAGLALLLIVILITRSKPVPPVIEASPGEVTVVPEKRSPNAKAAPKSKATESPTVAEAAPQTQNNPKPNETEIPADKAAPKAVAAPPPSKPVVVAAVAASKNSSNRQVKETSDDPVEDGKERSKLLAAYEKGDAETSLELAQKARDKALVDKLSRFIRAYDAANDAMLANNGTAAIKAFQKAIDLDEELSNGWGKYGDEIRRNLSNLYVLVALQFVSSNDESQAREAFEMSLKFDPANQRAQSQLAKLGVSAAKSPQVVDDVSDNEEKPIRSTPKRKSSSIDDAFDE